MPWQQWINTGKCQFLTILTQIVGDCTVVLAAEEKKKVLQKLITFCLIKNNYMVIVSITVQYFKRNDNSPTHPHFSDSP
jgi:hypothetical protein